MARRIGLAAAYLRLVRHRPLGYDMITLFDLVSVPGAAVGVVAGAAFGAERHGWPGLLLGAFGGTLAGSILGRLLAAAIFIVMGRRQATGRDATDDRSNSNQR